MEKFTELLLGPWPWYVAGPLIGLITPLLLIIDNKAFGFSANLRNICAMVLPKSSFHSNFDFKQDAWNLVFALGVVWGGTLGLLLSTPNESIELSNLYVQELANYQIQDLSKLYPLELFGAYYPSSIKAWLILVFGGFLVGFGSRYAGGCTSGHTILGIANLEWPSLLATVMFFIGGAYVSIFVIPFILAL